MLRATLLSLLLGLGSLCSAAQPLHAAQAEHPPSLDCKKLTCKALVIGNRDYKEPHARIESAALDAKEVVESLRKWDYAVGDPLRDLKSDDLKQAWNAFKSELEQASEGVALFYFSGHGMDVGDDSLLLPTDLPDVPDQATLLAKSLSLKALFHEFEEVQEKILRRNKRLDGIFIIDACRVLFADGKFKGSHTQSGGVRPLVPPPGLFVFYAASSGQVAHAHLTGQQAGRQPSVFTSKLVPLIARSRNLRLQAIAQKVRWEVFSAVRSDAAFKASPQTPDFFDRMIGFEINIGGQQIEAAEGGGEAKEKMLAADIEKDKRGNGYIVWEREDAPPLVVIPDLASDHAIDGGESPKQPDTDIDAPRIAVGITEVTRAQYRAYLEATGKCPKTGERHEACWQPSAGAAMQTVSNLGTTAGKGEVQNDKLPVTNVTWGEANGYVHWLNAGLNLSEPAGGPLDRVPDGRNGYYRLPTEAEWEYAARGGSKGPFVYGGDLSDTSKLCQFGNGADASMMSLRYVNQKCSDQMPRSLAPVGSYEANGYGLKDVHGNAWEWTLDCWTAERPRLLIDEKYRKPIADKCSEGRVVRGGSWRSAPESLTLTSRRGFSQDHARGTVGFRVVRVLSDCEFAGSKCDSVVKPGH